MVRIGDIQAQQQKLGGDSSKGGAMTPATMMRLGSLGTDDRAKGGEDRTSLILNVERIAPAEIYFNPQGNGK